MSNREWITDRLPTVEDADAFGEVWASHGDCVLYHTWSFIKEGTPWQPTYRPEPYVKPKRYTVKWLAGSQCWGVMDSHYVALRLAKLDHEIDEHREAAERIAAIYEETMS